MIRWLLVIALWSAATAQAATRVLVVDLGEAYTRSTALAGLLADVDKALQKLTATHRPERDALRSQLRELKAQGPATRDAQLVIARKLSDLEAAAELAEDQLANANQTAIAEVDAAIAEVKSALRTATGASAILDIQETLYVRPDCRCDATEELYAQLNARLPKVTLRLDP